MPTPSPKKRRPRGEATRERLLAAAEELLAGRLLEQISIQDVVRRARATVGSFYNLFPDKEALLPALYERSCARTLAALDERLRPAKWVGAALEDVVRSVVDGVVDLYRRERGLMRALVLRSHCRIGERAVERPPGMDEVVPRVAALVARWRDDIAHPRPRRAAAFGFLMVLATAREQLLYPQTTAYAVGVSERALAGELARAYLGYLRSVR